MRQKILELSYNPIAKAMYIMLKDTKVARTIRPDRNLSLDLDAKGNLVGIEVIRIVHLMESITKSGENRERR